MLSEAKASPMASICGKIGYSSAAEARATIVRLKAPRNRKRKACKALRAYRCPCGSWHITSQPERI
jgi:hypothetical protein